MPRNARDLQAHRGLHGDMSQDRRARDIAGMNYDARLKGVEQKQTAADAQQKQKEAELNEKKAKNDAWYDIELKKLEQRKSEVDAYEKRWAQQSRNAQDTSLTREANSAINALRVIEVERSNLLRGIQESLNPMQAREQVQGRLIQLDADYARQKHIVDQYMNQASQTRGHAAPPKPPKIDASSPQSLLGSMNKVITDPSDPNWGNDVTSKTGAPSTRPASTGSSWLERRRKARGE
jgi:hypothetical protein